jgi:DNA-binding transcriptional MerR regulator
MVLTITDLAAELGVRSDTLRYYERTGLISSAGRTPGGYRLYASDVADRVRFIKSAQRSGLRLRDIDELLVIMERATALAGIRRTWSRNASSRSTRRSPVSRRCGRASSDCGRTTTPVGPHRSRPGPV